MFRSTKTHGGRKSLKLGVQALEAREVPAGLFNPPIDLPVFLQPPPDLAGGTFETARVVGLPAMKAQAVSDHLPSAADVDLYRVTLKQGDFLAAEVDATTAVSPAATVQLLDAAGKVISGGRPVLDPGLFHSDP